MIFELSERGKAFIKKFPGTKFRKLILASALVPCRQNFSLCASAALLTFLLLMPLCYNARYMTQVILFWCRKKPQEMSRTPNNVAADGCFL